MRRIVSLCASLTAPIVGMFLLTSQVGAQSISGTYAFTLAEKCVHQLSGNVPGFDHTTLAIVDPLGAETYSGASDGLLVFDGNGGVTLQQGRATNIMNREAVVASTPSTPSRLIMPVSPPTPLGFGFGPALPFVCTGNYTVASGKMSVSLKCNATVPPNPMVIGFSSTFQMTGWVPLVDSTLPGAASMDHILLTDIGNTVQPVSIALVGGGTVAQERICTRATSLVLVSIATK